jgi:peptide/nickel transport system permease protein
MAVDAKITAPSLGPMQRIWRLIRASGRQSRRFPILPGLFTLLVVVCAIFAPWLAPHSPFEFDAKERLMPPAWMDGGSAQHPLGTDGTGRDVFSRLIYGAQISVMVALVAVTVSMLIGVTIGITAGFVGGWVDMAFMRLVDIFMSLPHMFIALAFAAVIPPGLGSVLTIIVFFSWVGYSRQTRGEVLSLKQRDFVALAKVAQASRWRIATRHILPNLINTLSVLATLQVGGVILLEASLSFLGLGIQPPTPSWGAMVSEGRNYISTAWWLTAFPGLAIALFVLCTNFIGDWLRDALDPRLRQI